MRDAKRQTIAFVSDAVYPYHFGGKEVRYHELASRLADRADLHVYTMNWWSGPRQRRDGVVTYHAICRHHSLYAGHRRSIAQALYFALSCFRLLLCRFDVLEADHMPYLQLPVLRLVATLKRKRLVVTWHEVWDLASWRQYLGWPGVAAWLIERCAMRLPDHIIAASPETGARLRDVLGSKASITIAPNGIDLQAVRTSLPTNSRADIVVVGRLMSHKRVDILLEAIALLKADSYPVTCRVVGDGPERCALAALATQLGIDDAVEFMHDVREQKELYSLLKSSRVFAFPSSREGFGIAVLEAIACGLPVVTTSAPDNLAQHLVASSSRGIVCAPSACALADGLRKFLSESKIEPVVSISEAFLEEYTWDSAVAKIGLALGI